MRAGRVYETPSLPWNFLDMPPSVNRIMGLIWAGETLYPQYYDWDVQRETGRFYELFYARPLTDEDISIIIHYEENRYGKRKEERLFGGPAALLGQGPL